MTRELARDPRPDFLLVGAPKAGTSALHLALAGHPDVFVTTPKEPKFWMCEDAPPPHWSGPGDRHSQQEWVWRREQYDDLFRPAPADSVRGESTPFYLWHRGAQQRIAAALPEVRLIAVVRDPIDRAYSNWMHLWSDGLEPEADFETAFGLEAQRVAQGHAPFWRYRDLGLYGEQLRDLYRHVDSDRVLIVRYRDIVDHPVETVDRACRFLGISEGQVQQIPRDNSRSYVAPGWRPRVIGPAVRAGARAGQFVRPEVWRALSVPLVARLQAGDSHRPSLTADQRRRLVPEFADDIRLLSELTGEDFSDWLSDRDRGSFMQRRRDQQALEGAVSEPA